MGDLNAVHGTLQSAGVEVSASASDVELVVEPKYVSMADLTTQETLPDDSSYIVVTKIIYSMNGVNNFYLHGGESPTPVQIGPKIRGVAGSSDEIDGHWAFPMGGPVKAAFVNEVGKITNIQLEYHVKHTQNRTPSTQDY